MPRPTWTQLTRASGLLIVIAVVVLVFRADELQTVAVIETLLVVAVGLLGLRWANKRNGNGNGNGR